MDLRTWAAKWSLPMQAVLELEQAVLGLLGSPDEDPAMVGKTEAYSQSVVRREAPRYGVLLFRNNVGALKDENGTPVRYGLANDSPALNEKVKSSDLIGLRKVIITPAHVGTTIAQFTAREMKAPGWRFTNTPREKAQLNFINLINASGGDASFATGEGSFK